MTFVLNGPQLRIRRTKIVATIGPASESEATITDLVAAGVDVVRLNMSHGDHDRHRQVFDRVCLAAAAANRPIAVLADLAGPKIRVGCFEGGSILLETGTTVILTTRDILGHPGLVPSQYSGLCADLRPGDRVLLADGLMELRVESVSAPDVLCQVIQGGRLADRKGMNLPGVAISAPSLTEKDRRDADFAIELGVDYLGLSFVRSHEDIEGLREHIAAAGSDVRIIAKIERPEALDDVDAILEATDAIMVARGDLGVELPPEQVPIIQNHLVGLARKRAKPVIVATQMLESMTDSPRPTRAEVADVSQTVLSGADAVMLSGETAAGKFPCEAVEMMDRIARQSESYLWSIAAFGTLTQDRRKTGLPSARAVAHSTAQLSRDLGARAIVVFSARGVSTAILSAARPAAPLLAVSACPRTCRWQNLLWGSVPMHVSDADMRETQTTARDLIRILELADPGDYILTLRGFHESSEQSVPSISVLRLGS